MPRRPSVPSLVRAIGATLRAERERRGWSQEVLADNAGLDRTYVSGIERGERSPNLRNIVRIVEALDVPLSAVVLAAEASGQRKA